MEHMASELPMKGRENVSQTIADVHLWSHLVSKTLKESHLIKQSL